MAILFFVNRKWVQYQFSWQTPSAWSFSVGTPWESMPFLPRPSTPSSRQYSLENPSTHPAGSFLLKTTRRLTNMFCYQVLCISLLLTFTTDFSVYTWALHCNCCSWFCVFQLVAHAQSLQVELSPGAEKIIHGYYMASRRVRTQSQGVKMSVASVKLL